MASVADNLHGTFSWWKDQIDFEAWCVPKKSKKDIQQQKLSDKQEHIYSEDPHLPFFLVCHSLH